MKCEKYAGTPNGALAPLCLRSIFASWHPVIGNKVFKNNNFKFNREIREKESRHVSIFARFAIRGFFEFFMPGTPACHVPLPNIGSCPLRQDFAHFPFWVGHTISLIIHFGYITIFFLVPGWRAILLPFNAYLLKNKRKYRQLPINCMIGIIVPYTGMTAK